MAISFTFFPPKKTLLHLKPVDSTMYVAMPQFVFASKKVWNFTEVKRCRGKLLKAIFYQNIPSKNYDISSIQMTKN